MKTTTVLPIIILLFLVVNCVNSSRKVTVKPPGTNDIQWTMYGKSDTGYLADKISIYIDDKEVMSGTLSSLHPSTTLSTTYKNYQIDAECDGGSVSAHKCRIYVDGNKYTELIF